MAFDPKLTADQRRWMLTHVGRVDDSAELALACARHFGLVDADDHVLGDQTEDGDPLEWGMWTHEDTAESHPVCDYADALGDVTVDHPELITRLVGAAATGDVTAIAAVMAEIDAACAEGLEVAP